MKTLQLSKLTKNWKVTLEKYYKDREMKVEKKIPLSSRHEHEQIEGKYGYIYLWEGDILAVTSEKDRIIFELSKNPHLKEYNRFVYLFSSSYLDEVATMIKAKRRPQLSIVERERRSRQMKIIRASKQRNQDTHSETVQLDLEHAI